MPKTSIPESEIRETTIHEEEFEIPCEISAARYGKKGVHRIEEHPADWACLKPCGHFSYICDEWYQVVHSGLYPQGFQCGQCGMPNRGYLNTIRLRPEN